MFANTLVNMANSFFITPFLLYKLGSEYYGLWILSLSLLGWFWLFTLGLPMAVQREISMHLAKNDVAKVNQVFTCGLVMFTSLGVVAAAALFTLSAFSESFNVNDTRAFTILLSVLCLKVFGDFFSYSFSGFFAGLLRFDIDQNIASIGVLIQTTMIVLLVDSWGIYSIVIATIITDVFIHSMQVYYAKKIYPPLKFDMALFNLAELRKLFDYAKHIIGLSITKLLYTRTDTIIITQMLGLNSVALFSIPSRLCVQVGTLTTAVSGVFFPILSRKQSLNEELQAPFMKIVRLNLFVSFSLYCPLLVLAGQFIVLWAGDSFASSVDLVGLMVFALLTQATAMPARDVLYAQANHKLFTVAHTVGAILNITLSITLIKTLGLIGLPLATALTFLIVDFCGYLVILKRYNDFKLRACMALFLLTCCLTYGLGYIGRRIASHFELDWVTLFVAGGITVLAILPFGWFLILTRDLREQLLQLVKMDKKLAFLAG